MLKAPISLADSFPLKHLTPWMDEQTLHAIPRDTKTDGDHRFNVIFCGPDGAAHLLGNCDYQRQSIDPGMVKLSVQNTKTTLNGNATGGSNDFRAEIICADNELMTPIHWKSESVVHDFTGNLIEETRLTEQGSIRDGKLTLGQLTTTVTGPVTLSWGLWDAVQRIPHDKTWLGHFTLIDGLCNQIKSNQSLRYINRLRINWHTRQMELHAYEHTGDGTIPTTYWIDECNRLLVVISGLIAYVRTGSSTKAG